MRICFVDTETTSLRPDRRAWDIALVIRDPGAADIEWSAFVTAADLDLCNADPASLRIGRFYERHPEYGVLARGWGGRPGADRAVALAEAEQLTRGAHLVGAVPGFDAETLAARMRARGICPAWHYHLQDFETLIARYLRGRGQPVPCLPWRSDAGRGRRRAAPLAWGSRRGGGVAPVMTWPARRATGAPGRGRGCRARW
jgi:hypothetical protein